MGGGGVDRNETPQQNWFSINSNCMCLLPRQVNTDEVFLQSLGSRMDHDETQKKNITK